MSGTSSGQTTKLAKLAFAVSMRTAGTAVATATPEKPVVVLPRPQGAPAVMSPGTFNVDNALRSQPMGSVSSSNDNSRSATMNSNVNVTVKRGERSAGDRLRCCERHRPSQRHELRNVQTAIR